MVLFVFVFSDFKVFGGIRVGFSYYDEYFVICWGFLVFK